MSIVRRVKRKHPIRAWIARLLRKLKPFVGKYHRIRSASTQPMTYPTVRQQDEFFAHLGIDPFRNNVEIVTVHDYEDRPMTVLYAFDRDGETRIAAHWPDEHQEMT